jgi:hypothetical protein
MLNGRRDAAAPNAGVPSLAAMRAGLCVLAKQMAGGVAIRHATLSG